MALSAVLNPFHCAHCDTTDTSWDRLKAHILETHTTTACCSYCGRFGVVRIGDDEGDFWCVDDADCEEWIDS